MLTAHMKHDIKTDNIPTKINKMVPASFLFKAQEPTNSGIFAERNWNLNSQDRYSLTNPETYTFRTT